LREIAAKLADSEDITAGLVETLTELENRKVNRTELTALQNEINALRAIIEEITIQV
jgi:hypothetical protein